MPRNLTKIVLILALCGPSFASARAMKPGSMEMSYKVVKGQHQVKGRFGSLWTEAEIREEAKRTCKNAGKKMSQIQFGETTKRKGTSFVAICS